MSDELLSRARYGEAFWRAHHEAWHRSELNQREYCEAHGIPLKAFGNWRAKFKAESQLQARKLLYRRGGLSHTLSHSLSVSAGFQRQNAAYVNADTLLTAPAGPCAGMYYGGPSDFAQFWISSPDTRWNSRSLFVTRIKLAALACAAIHRSLLPMT